MKLCTVVVLGRKTKIEFVVYIHVLKIC